MRVSLFVIGKTKSKDIRRLADEYIGRIVHYLPFELCQFKDESSVISELDGTDFFVVLDEHGKSISSREFAKFIAEKQMRGTKRLVFFIGAEDGIGELVRKRANFLLSLSKMTFPHELTQVMFVEQLYRALSINRGEPYHRE